MSLIMKKQKLKIVYQESKLQQFNLMGISFADLTTLSTDIVDEIFDATQRMFEKYPALKGSLVKYEVKFLKPSTIASTHCEFINGKAQYTIYFNSLIWIFGNIRKTIKENYSSNFLATKTIAGIVYHEIGHVINGLLISKTKLTINDFAYDWNNKIFAECLLNQYGIKKAIIEKISAYALKSYAESFAEIFAAYHENISIPKECKQMIGDLVF